VKLKAVCQSVMAPNRKKDMHIHVLAVKKQDSSLFFPPPAAITATTATTSADLSADHDEDDLGDQDNYDHDLDNQDHYDHEYEHDDFHDDSSVSSRATTGSEPNHTGTGRVASTRIGVVDLSRTTSPTTTTPPDTAVGSAASVDDPGNTTTTTTDVAAEASENNSFARMRQFMCPVCRDEKDEDCFHM
jgi:hypothetical protein